MLHQQKRFFCKQTKTLNRYYNAKILNGNKNQKVSLKSFCYKGIFTYSAKSVGDVIPSLFPTLSNSFIFLVLTILSATKFSLLGNLPRFSWLITLLVYQSLNFCDKCFFGNSLIQIFKG